MKRTVHINENELRNIIGESVKSMLKEKATTPKNTTFKHCHANESVSESNLRTIVESTYRGLVNECMRKKIEEKRELVRSIVSEMVYRSLKEGIRLKEDEDNPTPEEIAAEKEYSTNYFSNRYAAPKPEEEHEEGDVIRYEGFRIEKRNGIYTCKLSKDPETIMFSTSLNKVKENIDYIFSSIDPKAREEKMREYTESPYLCRTKEDGTTEINLDGFGYDNPYARIKETDEETYGPMKHISFEITSATYNKDTYTTTVKGTDGKRNYLWKTTSIPQEKADTLTGKTLTVGGAIAEPVELGGLTYTMLTNVKRTRVEEPA